MRTALMGAILLCGWCAAQQERTADEEVMLTEPGFHVPRARASVDAWRVYDFGNRARTAIQAGDRQRALDDVRSAIQAANRLRTMGAGTTVPIYVELAEDFSKAAPPPDNSNSRRFGAVDQPVDRITTMLGYTTMSLNVPQAGRRLEAARAALEDGEMKTADSALALAQDAVSFQSSERDMPLLKARQNLNLAAEQARAGDFEVAQTTLRTAARQLVEYSSAAGAQAAGARQLADEVNSCAESIVARHEDANARIEQFWDRAAALGG